MSGSRTNGAVVLQITVETLTRCCFNHVIGEGSFATVYSASNVEDISGDVAIRIEPVNIASYQQTDLHNRMVQVLNQQLNNQFIPQYLGSGVLQKMKVVVSDAQRPNAQGLDVSFQPCEDIITFIMVFPIYKLTAKSWIMNTATPNAAAPLDTRKETLHINDQSDHSLFFQGMKICCSVALALELLHAKKAVHCDIKADNVFLVFDLLQNRHVVSHAVLGDLGLSFNTTAQIDSYMVNRLLCAPEILKNKRMTYSTAADVYQYALFFMSLILRDFSIFGVGTASNVSTPVPNVEDIIQRQVGRTIDMFQSNSLISQILTRSLSPEPEKRPPVAEWVNALSYVVLLQNMCSPDSLIYQVINRRFRNVGLRDSSFCPTKLLTRNHIVVINAAKKLALWCAGNNSHKQLTVSKEQTNQAGLIPIKSSAFPPGVVIIQACGGCSHSLFLSSQNLVYVIGKNSEGQLGLNNRKQQDVLTQIPGVSDIVQICTSNEYIGEAFSMLLKRDGTAFGMGSGCYGQLGNGTKDRKLSPTQVKGLDNIHEICCGYYHSLFLKNDGTVWISGGTQVTSTNLSVMWNRKVFPTILNNKELKNITQISSGAGHSLCLRQDGKVFGFGFNLDGQIGMGTCHYFGGGIEHVYEVIISDVKQISCGRWHSLFLRNDGSVMGTGYSKDGELGNGSKESRSVPIFVTSLPNGLRFAKVAAGSHHSLFLSENGDVYSCGYNSHRQLGTGGDQSVNLAVAPVTGIKNCKYLGVGEHFSFFLTEE